MTEPRGDMRLLIEEIAKALVDDPSQVSVQVVEGDEGEGILLELRVALIHLGVECGGIETFSGYGKLIDKRELEISQAFDLSIASGLTESCSTTARDGNRRGA